MNTITIKPRFTSAPVRVTGSFPQAWKQFMRDSEVKIEMHVSDDTGFAQLFELPPQSLSFLEEAEQKFIADVEKHHNTYTQAQITAERRELEAKLKELDTREASLKRKAPAKVQPHPKTGGKKLSCVAVKPHGKKVKASKKDEDSSYQSEEYENDSDPDEAVSEELSESMVETGKKLKHTGRPQRQRKPTNIFRPEEHADDKTKTKALVPDDYVSPELRSDVKNMFKGIAPPYRRWLRDEEAFTRLWVTDPFFIAAYNQMRRLWHCGLDNTDHTYFTDSNLHAWILNVYSQNGVAAMVGYLHYPHHGTCAACGQTKALTMGFQPDTKIPQEFHVGVVCGKGLMLIEAFLHWLGKSLAELRELGDALPTEGRVATIIEDWCLSLGPMQNYKLT
jgi:hypothetical protein